MKNALLTILIVFALSANSCCMFESGDDVPVAFSGIAELVETADGPVLQVYADVDQAVAAGVSASQAEHLFALASGSCQTKKNKAKATIDCLDVNCAGVCVVYSAMRGPNPGEPEKEGPGPITMQAGRFYWCSCD